MNTTHTRRFVFLRGSFFRAGSRRTPPGREGWGVREGKRVTRVGHGLRRPGITVRGFPSSLLLFPVAPQAHLGGAATGLLERLLLGRAAASPRRGHARLQPAALPTALAPRGLRPTPRLSARAHPLLCPLPDTASVHALAPFLPFCCARNGDILYAHGTSGPRAQRGHAGNLITVLQCRPRRLHIDGVPLVGPQVTAGAATPPAASAVSVAAEAPNKPPENASSSSSSSNDSDGSSGDDGAGGTSEGAQQSDEDTGSESASVVPDDPAACAGEDRGTTDRGGNGEGSGSDGGAGDGGADSHEASDASSYSCASDTERPDAAASPPGEAKWPAGNNRGCSEEAGSHSTSSDSEDSEDSGAAPKKRGQHKRLTLRRVLVSSWLGLCCCFPSSVWPFPFFGRS